VAQFQWIQAPEKSLISTTTDGESIVADYFSCQWQLEIGNRQGQVDNDSFSAQ
jgi:hypothetical protein